MSRSLVLILIFSKFISAFGQGVQEDYWYKSAVIYNLDVNTFKDSDGNGRGDFDGLIQKLDYIQSLGANTIWLAPFQPSPHRDDGFDVANYYGIDTNLGNPGRFAAFMFQAKKRGMRVIMDMVLNHTSDQHPWFKQSRANPQSKYRSWYTWLKKRPADWNKGMGFPGIETETWRFDDVAKQYYFHRFYKFQPELNFTNPQVREEVKSILNYWLGQGIDGFRMDAVPFMIDIPETSSEHPKQMFEIIPETMKSILSHKNESMVLTEANVLPKENEKFFGKSGEGIPMMFNFYVNQFLFYGLASGDTGPLVKALNETQKIPANSQWAYFLRNHDEVDLGRLTSTQRQLVYSKFGPDKTMQLYDRGIRRRFASMVENSKQREMAYSMLFALPGTLVLRYGDEIEMGDNQNLKERLAVRTPMQWSTEKNAGFSTSDTVFRPVISEGKFSYENDINVAFQMRDPKSFLNWTIKMLRIRKECSEIFLGKWKVLNSPVFGILIMQYSYQGQTVITVHNFTKEAQQIRFKPEFKGDILFDLLAADGDKFPGEDGQFPVYLEGFGYKWYKLK